MLYTNCTQVVHELYTSCTRVVDKCEAWSCTTCTRSCTSCTRVPVVGSPLREPCPSVDAAVLRFHHLVVVPVGGATGGREPEAGELQLRVAQAAVRDARVAESEPGEGVQGVQGAKGAEGAEHPSVNIARNTNTATHAGKSSTQSRLE